MIKRIKVKNFKALKLAELEFSHLNLFAGLNGMGKSSFLQVLLLLRQSYLQNLLLHLNVSLMVKVNTPDLKRKACVIHFTYQMTNSK
ncbi:MAG: hypothetical protein DRQ49_16085 [Gammaproteobacteria bacterium]|nr:MAG: hypothetical protein DRQ49_16085 [Gammaproteobacteria bacterium]RKZ75826.1 MAG: hypothetical protein DRQ57_05945 [Gammaproteobacteria bacterium]